MAQNKEFAGPAALHQELMPRPIGRKPSILLTGVLDLELSDTDATAEVSKTSQRQICPLTHSHWRPDRASYLEASCE